MQVELAAAFCLKNYSHYIQHVERCLSSLKLYSKYVLKLM